MMESLASELSTSDDVILADMYFGTTSSKTNSIWWFDGTTATRIGVPNPNHLSKVTLADGQSLRDGLSTLPMFRNDRFVIYHMALEPGSFYPRMARPSDQHPLEVPGSFPCHSHASESLVSSLNQLRSLMRILDDLFQSIHPVEPNMSCYGGVIRNLLLLACTECETQWRSILSANNYTTARFSTKDFVKLCPAMRLSEYKLRLQHCPWLPLIEPFAGWDETNPTLSLKWYDDYNAAKHDREKNFSRATLKSAINAVAAAWITVIASYGIHGRKHYKDVDIYFDIVQGPKWRYSEVYIYPSVFSGARPFTRNVLSILTHLCRHCAVEAARSA